VRWLMPFDGTWFYGDTLYIADPWMWTILAIALVAARWRRDRAASSVFARPACVGLIAVVAYITAMATGEAISRRVVEASLGDAEAPRLMIAPVPVDPFERYVVIDAGSEYRVGVVTLLPQPQFRLDPRRVPKGENAEARAAAATRDGRIFLGWARFPFFQVDASVDPPAVYMIDARYTLDRNAVFGSVRIPLSKT